MGFYQRGPEFHFSSFLSDFGEIGLGGWENQIVNFCLLDFIFFFFLVWVLRNTPGLPSNKKFFFYVDNDGRRNRCSLHHLSLD